MMFRSQLDSSQLTLSRRRWLHHGFTGAGLCLSNLLQMRAWAQPASDSPLQPLEACIVIFYYGGPSHLDTYDLKPNAPADIRGEFNPISTKVPGLAICEHLPQMARMMHKVALIRSMHHSNRLHDSASTEVLTGRQSPVGDREEFAPIRQFYPSVGSTVSYLRRELDIELPHAALPFVFHNVVDVPCQGGGFLGSIYDPLQIDVDAAERKYRAGTISMVDGLTTPTVESRRRLLASMQPAAFGAQAMPLALQWQNVSDRAFRLLASKSVIGALDLTQELASVRERYGYGLQPKSVGEGGNGAELGTARHMRGQNLLVARRLVEAGVPFVNVYDFKQQGQNWDAHSKNFNQHKTHLLPLADQSLSALIEDLDARGMLETTLVVAMGEFGRTPKINKEGGRDHWPDCYTVLLAGGGVHGGAVWGASDRLGAFPANDPVTPADLVATIFWRFGFDPTTEMHDASGRPWRIADGQPLKRLFA